MPTTTKTCTIINGPDKRDLMLGLFNDTGQAPRIVFFNIQPIGSTIKYIDVPIIINGIDRGSGSGEEWLIRGYNNQNKKNFHGHFNTHTRKGWIVYIE